MKQSNRIVSIIVAISFFFSSSFAHANNTLSQTYEITEMLKNSEYKSGESVTDWSNKNKNQLHPKMINILERLQKSNPDLKLPRIQVNDFKSSHKETTRLTISNNKEQIIIDLYSKNGKAVASLNGQEFDYDNLYYDKLIDSDDINPMLTLNQLEEIYQVNPKYAAFYQEQFRAFVNALTETTELLNLPVKKPKFSMIDLILNCAHASVKDGKCVIAGFLSQISKVGICGGEDQNRESFYCDGKSLNSGYKCNPLVYGLTTDNKPFCVPFQKNQRPATYVSENCNKNYPLNDEKNQSDFVSSIIKNKEQLGIADEAQYFQNLKDHITSASQGCGINSQAVEQRLLESPPRLFVDQEFENAFPIQKSKGVDYNLGHRTACKFLMNRLILAKKAANCSENISLASKSPDKTEISAIAMQCPTKNSSAEILSVTTNNNNKDNNEKPLPVKTEIVKSPEPEKKFCSKSGLHKIGCFTGLALGVCLILGCFKKKKKKNWVVYTIPPKTVGKPGELENPNPSTNPNRPKSNSSQGVNF